MLRTTFSIQTRETEHSLLIDWSNIRFKKKVNTIKKDKIMVKDIIGSMSANTAISGKEIGKVNILDKFSFVDVPVNYVDEVLTGMKDKPIKGKNVNIEIANS